MFQAYQLLLFAKSSPCELEEYASINKQYLPLLFFIKSLVFLGLYGRCTLLQDQHVQLNQVTFDRIFISNTISYHSSNRLSSLS
ncbi:hypothetical protein CW304_09355 [Bacillus sp. UFRGS-B20]|nr:hypothetical protein CW304_09355 [Bacillus sp. UFRGS-B20]